MTQFEEQAGSSQRSTPTPTHHNISFSLRALIPSRDAGLIIGKSGKNVQEIREQTEARIRVSEMVPGASDRVLTVYGSTTAIANAFGLIANRILEDSVNRHSHKAGLNHQSGSISIRLLVPHGQLGAVIGKSGSMIRQIQSETGTRIIASEQMLTNSTDRTVQISGVPENVCAAVKMIADVIESTFGTERASGHIPYKPVVHQHQHQYHNESGHHQKLMKSKLGSDQSFPDENTNSGGNQQDGGETTVQTQQIYVPDDMVGCVIGRAGVKINDIRRKSGSQIRIADATADSNERLVTITGTVEGNQRALLMVYACLEAENKRKEMLAAASTEAPEPLVETSH